MNETVTPPTAPADPSTDPQPSIDTSCYDATSTYDPVPKDGTYLAELIEFAPGTNPENGRVESWKLAVALIAADATDPTIRDDTGGTLPEGHRVIATLFTAPSQYRTAEQCKRQCMEVLQGLNGIVRDAKADPRFEKADAAFKALPPSKKTPTPDDPDLEHYAQWKRTAIKVQLKARKNKDTGVMLTNIVGVLAAPRKG